MPDLSVSSLKMFFLCVCVCWWVQVIPFFLFYQIQSLLCCVEVLDPFEVEFCAFDRYIFIFILLHTVTQDHLLKIFSQFVCYSLIFIKKSGIYRYMEFCWAFNLQFDFIYQWVNFEFQYYAVSIIRALKYSLKSGRVMPAAVLVLLEIVLAILGFLCCLMMLTFFSISLKNWLHWVYNQL